MDFITTFISINSKLLLFYLCTWLLSSLALYFLSKYFYARQNVLNGLLLVENLLTAKLGDKASAILNVWIDGLNKIQDGEFSSSDGLDQFLRYLRLAVKNYGIELSDRDIDILQTIILSTFDTFLKSKPKEIEVGISKFCNVSSLGYSKI